MKKQFLIFIAVAFIIFFIGALVGPNKGTTDSFMYWPIIAWFAAGLIYFGAWGIKGLKKKKK